MTLTAHRFGVRGDMVEVVVSDTGPGLADDEIALACRRGWRAADSLCRPGEGLGLAQVDELIAAEGGRVILEPTLAMQNSATRGLMVRLQVPTQPPH